MLSHIAYGHALDLARLDAAREAIDESWVLLARL